MNAETPRLRDYIDHIVKTIDRIQEYTSSGEAHFMESALHQDAVIRNLEIVGEASRNIAMRYPTFAADNPELPLNFAYAMRNILAHGYFTVDMEIVRRTISNDLPGLKKELIELGNTLNDD